jgi:hypothetical protein
MPTEMEQLTSAVLKLVRVVNKMNEKFETLMKPQVQFTPEMQLHDSITGRVELKPDWGMIPKDKPIPIPKKWREPLTATEVLERNRRAKELQDYSQMMQMPDIYKFLDYSKVEQRVAQMMGVNPELEIS